ncbi:SDR family NAD(P)-dependent oxidoreductase [Desertibaculum subflavum]|uniref:SDR family NAD(P)-dependent oxidoreductase n=1 Tax=Desertibaculum subflavum TaxID=2268458 RepID=UPI000E661791
MILAGRTAIITGASLGLGAAIARRFVEEGASVALCARDGTALDTVVAALQYIAVPGQKVLGMPADVARTADVETLVAQAIEAFGGLDVLVNNAGVYGPMGPLETVPWAAWVEAIAINLHGTVYPCRAVLPHFKARGRGKIINISGGGATNPLPNISAYAASKAAVVRFTETLAEETRGFGIDVNAVAPGALNTRLTDELLQAGPDKVGADFHARMQRIQREGGTPLEKGAALCAWLASPASDGITGKLISAVWDPWADLPAHRADLDDSDIYTLRRIVPKDRGKLWGDP